MIQGCLLRTQKCLVGRSHEVSSKVPARTRCRPSPGLPVLKSQQPHSGQTRRTVTRPLSAIASSGRGSSPVRRKPATARERSKTRYSLGAGSRANLCVDLAGFCGVWAELRVWLRRGPHQFAQPDEIVGSDSQREYPADTGQTAMTGLAETGDRLGPAEHLLNALAHPPTDRIAGVAGRSTVDCRPPVRRVLRDMRRHIVLAQIGDEAGHIIGLVGTEREDQ